MTTSTQPLPVSPIPASPGTDMLLLLHVQDLEVALRMLTDPAKLQHVTDTLEGLKTLYIAEGPSKAVFNLVATIAWLTSPETLAGDL